MDALRQYVASAENTLAARAASAPRPTLARRASLKESLKGACGFLPQSKSTPDMHTPLLKAYGLTTHRQHPGEFTPKMS